MFEVIVMLASGIGSGVRYIGTHFLGMSVSDDDIANIVRSELKEKHSS